MDREAWCAAIHGVVKSRTQLSDWTELTETARRLCPWDFPGKNTEWVAIFSPGIFRTQGSNLSLLYWQVDSLPLFFFLLLSSFERSRSSWWPHLKPRLETALFPETPKSCWQPIAKASFHRPGSTRNVSEEVWLSRHLLPDSPCEGVPSSVTKPWISF